MGISGANRLLVIAGILICPPLASACRPQTLVELAQKAPPAPPPQKRITYSIKGFCPAAGNSLADFFLLNASYVLVNGQIAVDTDRDGIPDVLDNEADYGITAISAFSSGEWFGDLSVFATGTTLAAQRLLRSAAACDDPTLDSDGDGIPDCAERTLLKTDPLSFSTAADGLTDELKLRFGLNPLDPWDAQLNPSGDGLSNYQKIKKQLPISESLTAALAPYAHQYRIEPSNADGGGDCYDLTVSQIPVVDVSNGNLILTNILEKQSGQPTASPTQLNRCCSVVPTSVSNDAKISVTWGESQELLCPCPLELDPVG